MTPCRARQSKSNHHIGEAYNWVYYHLSPTLPTFQLEKKILKFWGHVLSLLKTSFLRAECSIQNTWHRGSIIIEIQLPGNSDGDLFEMVKWPFEVKWPPTWGLKGHELNHLVNGMLCIASPLFIQLSLARNGFTTWLMAQVDWGIAHRAALSGLEVSFVKWVEWKWSILVGPLPVVSRGP